MRLATVIRKDAAGKERTYYEGISSGPALDSHGERMTKECVADFQRQAAETTILFVHPHTDNLSEHIGKLENCWLTESGEWGVSLRTWDESDIAEGVPVARVQAAKDFVNMTTGQGVYKKPVRISQFSIQGLVDKKDVTSAPDGTRAINHLQLDAIAAVTMGAYPQDNFSTVEKIFKQYDRAVKQNTLNLDDTLAEWGKEFHSLEWSKDLRIKEIMQSAGDPASKAKEIDQVLADYAMQMKELLANQNYTLPEEPGMDPQEEQAAAAAPEAGAAGGDIAAKLAAVGQELVKLASSISGGGAAPAAMTATKDDVPGETQPGEKTKAQEDEQKRKADEEVKRKAEQLPGANQSPGELPPKNLPEGDGEVDPAVNKARKAMEEMGMSKSAIDEQIRVIKSKANPAVVMRNELDRMRQDQLTGMAQIGKAISSLTSALNNIQIAAPQARNVQKSAPAGHVAQAPGQPAQKGAPGADPRVQIQKSLDRSGMDRAQSQDPYGDMSKVITAHYASVTGAN